MKIAYLSPAAALAAGAGLFWIAGCGGKDALTDGASSGGTVVVRKADSGSGGGAKSAPAAENAGAAPAAAAVAGGMGTIKGKVTFVGSAPTLPPLIRKGQQMKDGAVCAAHEIADEKLIIDSSGGVANVVVFLAKAPEGSAASPVPATPATLDNKGCHFVPHVLLLRAGQELKIENDDAPLSHNTHIYAKRNTPFNDTVPKAGKQFVFTKSENEPIEIKCDIHSWMHGWAFPLDHPYAAVTGPNGEFEIKNVPAGKHSFRVWHESAVNHYLSRNLAVTVNPGQTTNVDIKYDAASYGG